MEGPLIRLLELLLPYRGRVVGTLAGLALAWLLVTYGFWRTLVILAFGVLGYLVGAERDRRGSVRRVIRRFWWGDHP
ncbi:MULTISPECIES: DUF2273 domain-containing protein [Limnochorda]|mgnify:CR=1 FL=1|uniref:DUF2273 domain-containing protein n=1 Tax=Limnochorda TaxID=1676651 RepID=UPI0026E99324|nr:DUF2273 domain-containing protein [Limnochorda pilosa]